jgi:CheY-like chemotaxis protein
VVSDRTVLVVDDFADGRELLAEYLQWRGFEVETATSGDEAIAAVARSRPAAILMDLGMPGMDGWEATRQIRALPGLADVLIVAVTAHALSRETDAALRAGCDAVVAKPFDLAAFADALTVALTEGPVVFKRIPDSRAHARRTRAKRVATVD